LLAEGQASDIELCKLLSDPLTNVDVKRLHELQKNPRYSGELWQNVPGAPSFPKNLIASQDCFNAEGASWTR